MNAGTRVMMVLAIGWLVLATATSRARAAPRDRGTHFLAELEAGGVLTGSGGPAMRLAFGAGAKWRSFPVRFYLVGQLGTSSYTAQAPPPYPTASSSEEGAFQDLALGPRLYVPVWGPLRVFVEGLVGATFASATRARYAGATLTAHEWLALLQLSAGLQWRILYQLSLGARASVALNEAGLVGVARYAGVHSDARPSITGAVTWHF